MYHYLFTNDLRISTLDESLQNAGRCFITGTVPSASQNKSANNNMKTLGFYFNLTEDSICAKQAADGNIRSVVFNFIKKFQFPNIRTQECLDNCIADGITIAPMRVIIKVLYTMNLLYGSTSSYLTREEIKYFIFYNDAVAKTKNLDFIKLINDIIEYRKTSVYPDTVSNNDVEHEWKQEDRQIREMVKVLKWSGCVVENEEKITITSDGLSQENKAAIYDIIDYHKFWTGDTIESYRKYMDMTEEESEYYGEQRYLKNEDHTQEFTLCNLAKILKNMYEAAVDDKNMVAAIHVFGIKYGKEIKEGSFVAKDIVLQAGISESYVVELNKALKIYKCLSENTFGLSFGEDKSEKPIENDDRETGGENILYYGVPGSGKSYAISKICSEEEYMERVVFHPDYTYSDFVGQILPRLNSENKLEYVFTPGPFTRVLQKAFNNPENMYYLIIEEINRGNAPAIFGEIFQLLDRNEKGTSEYGISNYEVANEVYKNSNHPVKIPSNLTVLATMNTSDQNVFTLDTAFQRRWKMKHIPNKFNDEHAKDIIQGTQITWGAFATVINEMVVDISLDMTGSGDKRLGAYFAKIHELKADIFPEKVLKYLWDDAFRMDKETIFDEKYKSLEDIIEVYEQSSEDKLKSVLRSSVYKKMLDKVDSAESGSSTDIGDEQYE